MLLSLPRLRALGAARVGTDATWPLHLLLGWVLASLASMALTVALADVGAPRRSEWLSHAVDLGRHVGLGLASTLLVWAFRRLLPRASGLGWLAFLAASIALGARVLPTDLDGLAERSAESWALPAALVSALIVIGVGSS